MKQVRNNWMPLVVLLYIMAGSGCKEQGHKKEQSRLRKERLEAEKATSDLSVAVKLTDEAGWNGNEIYNQYKTNVSIRLAKDSVALAKFKDKVRGKRTKIPLLYRSRIKRLEIQIAELKNRLNNYKLKDKADWDDFEMLFNDDMKRMEQATQKLIGR